MGYMKKVFDVFLVYSDPSPASRELPSRGSFPHTLGEWNPREYSAPLTGELFERRFTSHSDTPKARLPRAA